MIHKQTIFFLIAAVQMIMILQIFFRKGNKKKYFRNKA